MFKVLMEQNELQLMLEKQLCAFFYLGTKEHTILATHYETVISRMKVALSGFSDVKYNMVIDNRRGGNSI